MAIRWVYENIHKFGGDSSQITLLGHSAGAASVGYHLISKNSRQYIQSAIFMSGSVLAPWASQHKSRDNAIILAKSLICPFENSTEMVTCLKVSTYIYIFTIIVKFLSFKDCLSQNHF